MSSGGKLLRLLFREKLFSDMVASRQDLSASPTSLAGELKKTCLHPDWEFDKSKKFIHCANQCGFSLLLSPLSALSRKFEDYEDYKEEFGQHLEKQLLPIPKPTIRRHWSRTIAMWAPHLVCYTSFPI